MSNYTYYTNDMIPDTKEAMLELIAKMMKHVPEYLKFCSHVEDTVYQGIELEFYEYDGDDYGDGITSKPVVKWKVEFHPLTEKRLVFRFRGYLHDVVHRLYDNSQKKFIFQSNSYTEAMDFVEEDEWLLKECEGLSEEEVRQRFVWKDILKDKIKDWTSDFVYATIITEPDPHAYLEEEKYE